MEDERLERGGSILSDRYFEEQLQPVREIRLLERKFYQKITDIYAKSVRLRRDGTGHQALLRHRAERASLGHPWADRRSLVRCPGGHVLSPAVADAGPEQVDQALDVVLAGGAAGR